MTSAFRRFYYHITTDAGTINCRDLMSAEYLFGCRKHAALWKTDRRSGIQTLIKEK